MPLIRQADFFCGPTALAMVMQWSGHDVTPETLAAQSFTPGARGTFQSDMLGTARRQGHLATPVKGLNGLLTEVAAGNPVIVFQNLGLRIAPLWHYAVTTAYDLDRQTVTLHSGQHDRMVMSQADFLQSWRGGDFWALTVLPPDRLPASADRLAILDAAAALERVGRPSDAVHTYRAGADRWPTDWLWPFGLGNALYASGDLNGAARAFGRAVALAPDAPEPRNNLNEVLKELRGN